MEGDLSRDPVARHANEQTDPKTSDKRHQTATYRRTDLSHEKVNQLASLVYYTSIFYEGNRKSDCTAHHCTHAITLEIHHALSGMQPAINTESRLSGEGTTAVDVIVMRSHVLPSIIHTLSLIHI